MTVPRLSICIATLNRAAFLDTMLDSIVSQATDEIEIVIVDGASTDSTPQVVAGYQKKFPCINYLRLEAKGGVDQDYNRAVELAQGSYCWLMSDDDKLKPGAIQAVLNAIQGGYSLVIVNAEVCNLDLAERLTPSILNMPTSQIYAPSEQDRLLIDIANYLTFIGAVVIKREIWIARKKDEYLGTGFIHMGVIFQAPLPKEALVIAEPWIMIRYGNASWAGKAFETWAFKWPDLIWNLPGFSDSIKMAVCVKEPWRNMKGLLVYRAKGLYALKEYDAMLHFRLGSPRDKFVAKNIARFPGHLANLIMMIYFALTHPQDNLSQSELRASPFYFRNLLPSVIGKRAA